MREAARIDHRSCSFIAIVCLTRTVGRRIGCRLRMERLEAAINPLPGGPYDRSVEEGRQELVAYLTDRAALCPDEVFVLGG